MARREGKWLMNEGNRTAESGHRAGTGQPAATAKPTAAAGHPVGQPPVGCVQSRRKGRRRHLAGRNAGGDDGDRSWFTLSV